MKCPNCGSEVKDTADFCRTCAAPVAKYRNSGFYRAEREVKQVEKKPESFSLKKEIDSIKNMISDEPLRDPNEPLENKDRIKKDSNNRQKATILNFVELGVILIVVWIVIKILTNLISKL